MDRCASRISAESFIALCMTCKDLHFLGTSIFSQRADLVQGWVKEALACSRGGPERYSTILKWLLGQAIKVWGVTTLPAKLDLQGALLQTDPADVAARIVISVGARLTDDFIFAASTLGPGRRSAGWVRLYKGLGLATCLSPALEALCLDPYRRLSQQQLQQLSAEERYSYLTVASTSPERSANPALQFLIPRESIQGWSKQQVYTSLRLVMDAARDSNWDARCFGGWDTEGIEALDLMESLEILLSLPAAAQLSPDELVGLLDTACSIDVGQDELLTALMPFVQQLTAYAVEISCKALLQRATRGYDKLPHIMLLLSMPAAQQLSGYQVACLVKLATAAHLYSREDTTRQSTRQLLRLQGAAAIEPERLRSLLNEVLDRPEEVVLLEEVRDLLVRVPLSTRIKVVELIREECNRPHCLIVQQENEDAPCHACLLLQSMTSAAVPAMGAAAATATATVGGRGQGVNAGNAELEYASVNDLPYDKKLALLKQAVHHHRFGELLFALTANGDGSRDSLAPQLQGMMFQVFQEAIVRPTPSYGVCSKEQESALKQLLRQKESGLLSKEQVRELVEFAKLQGLRTGHKHGRCRNTVHALLVEGFAATRGLEQ